MKRVAIDNVSVLQDNKGVWFRGTLIAGKTKGKRTATMLMFCREQKKHKTNKQKTTFQYAPQKAVSYSEASKSLSHLLGYTGEMRVQTGHITSSALSVSKWETLCQWCPMASWGQEQWTDLHNVTLRGRFGQCWYFNGHCYCNVKGANWSVLIF